MTRDEYQPGLDDPEFRKAQRKKAGLSAEEDSDDDDEVDDDDNEDPEDEPENEDPNQKPDKPERVVRKVRKMSVTSHIGQAVKEGAKLAAASELNEIICSGVKKALANAGMDKKMLDSAGVEFTIKLLGPALIILIAEKFPDMVPKADLVRSGAKLALTSSSAEVIQPAIMMVTPMLKQIAGFAEKHKELDEGEEKDEEKSAGKVVQEDRRGDIEVEPA